MSKEINIITEDGVDITIHRDGRLVVFGQYVTLVPRNIDIQKLLANLSLVFTNDTFIPENPFYERIMEKTKELANNSPHVRTKVASIVYDANSRNHLKIFGTGTNGFCGSLENEDNYNDIRMTSRSKCSTYTLHAEAKAILDCQHKTENMGICVWPLPPCVECAKLIVQSGIKEVLVPDWSIEDFDRWIEAITKGVIVLTMANVKICKVILPSV